MCPLEIYTHKFHSAEAAYQYRKAIFLNNFSNASEVIASKDSWNAMEIGNKIKGSGDWNNFKEQAMEEVL